ncbi:hypothetical protein HMPREF1544_09988 [Mucor circinelloides 1006PhL]|uniref:Uncharacterized protein n=1 Tax=Mucor circinelloides f. circinelloides (strain 1006PhL) TaxID=1220926 RepID=S2J0Z1_MUCC1|nr:hypothetical protein HMPREF1544_09988 [Mucor circinelloides 1006PhL]
MIFITYYRWDHADGSPKLLVMHPITCCGGSDQVHEATQIFKIRTPFNWMI